MLSILFREPGAAERPRPTILRRPAKYRKHGRDRPLVVIGAKLLQHFNGEGGIKTVTLAPIVYGDYDDVTMAGIEERDDTLAALKYKGTSWIHENEMRAILLYNMFYVFPQIPKYGERLAVSLGDFINHLILAPNATAEYERKARDVVTGTSVEKMLTRSAL